MNAWKRKQFYDSQKTIMQRLIRDKKYSLRDLAKHYHRSPMAMSQVTRRLGIKNRKAFRIENKALEQLRRDLSRQQYLRNNGYTREDFMQASSTQRRLMKRFTFKRRYCSYNKIPFTLRFNGLIFPNRCPVLGIKIDYVSSQSPGVRNDRGPSYDRLSPKGGYTKENVRIISWRANRLKSDGSAKEHELIAKWLRKELRQ